MDLPTAAAQAREALALGTSEEETPVQSFYSFSDYYAKYLLQELKKAGVVKMAASPCYEVLRQYDETHNGDLCYIFYAISEKRANINQTATAIFQHRNTVLIK